MNELQLTFYTVPGNSTGRALNLREVESLTVRPVLNDPSGGYRVDDSPAGHIFKLA